MPSEVPSTPTPTPKARKRRSIAADLMRTVAVIAVVLGVTRVFVSPFEVDGRSMVPGLQDHDRIFVNRAQYAGVDVVGLIDRLPILSIGGSWVWRPFGEPERGDIVVLDPPTSHDSPYIKRVIGLAGEQVTFVDGQVLIDGVPLDEPYLAGASTDCTGRWCDAGPIPAGMVFVLGDNRGRSADSRQFGPVTIDDLLGQAWFTNWPVAGFGFIQDVTYDRAGE